MTGALSSASIYLFVALVIAAISVIPFIVFVYLRDRSVGRYDKDARKVTLSAMRNSYEAKIADLTRRLTATEARWEDVNHLLLSNQDAQDDGEPGIVPITTPIFEEMNISSFDIEMQNDLVFVLTPFADSESSTYLAIKSACQTLNLACMRGDEDFVEGDILRHVVTQIARARIVVANVGSRNPNVFYELGIAHALGKQTVLVGKTLDEVPFDISTKRVVLYSSEGVLKVKLQQVLRKALHIPGHGNTQIAPA